jgi:hypothetical protein
MTQQCKHCSKGKRRWTWRKWVIAAFLLLMFSGVIDSFVLSHLSLDPNAEVAVELIKTFGAAFIGYLMADTGDHYSANRFGRNEEDI